MRRKRIYNLRVGELFYFNGRDYIFLRTTNGREAEALNARTKKIVNIDETELVHSDGLNYTIKPNFGTDNWYRHLRESKKK